VEAHGLERHSKRSSSPCGTSLRDFRFFGVSNLPFSPVASSSSCLLAQLQSSLPLLQESALRRVVLGFYLGFRRMFLGTPWRGEICI
jgi:hypothetical protein